MIEKVENNKQIKVVEKLASEIWCQHYTPIIGRAQIDYMLEKFQSQKVLSEQLKQGFLYYLIKIDNNYIGYFAVMPGEDELFLSKLYIKSSERGKKFGKKAIQFIENLAEEKGLHKIILTVNKNNTDSIKAYEKMGFKNTKSVVKDIGNNFIMDDYKMEKMLESKPPFLTQHS